MIGTWLGTTWYWYDVVMLSAMALFIAYNVRSIIKTNRELKDLKKRYGVK